MLCLDYLFSTSHRTNLSSGYSHLCNKALSKVVQPRKGGHPVLFFLYNLSESGLRLRFSCRFDSCMIAVYVPNVSRESIRKPSYH